MGKFKFHQDVFQEKQLDENENPLTISLTPIRYDKVERYKHRPTKQQNLNIKLSD